MIKLNLIDELKRLFDFVKQVDEFQFVNILIGYNGMGDQRFLSHLYESEILINEIKILIDNTSDMHTKARLGLLLYGHIFEMDELYNVLGNLLRVATAQNLRYIPDLYNRNNQNDFTPTEKFKLLLDHATQCRFDNFIKVLQSLYYNRIRNAFAHSSYSLIDDDFIFIKGKGVEIEGLEKKSIQLEEFLIPLIDKSLLFINEFFNLLKVHKMSYTANIVIQGNLSNTEPIMILGDPENGLIGFESFSGSSIKLKNAYGTDRYLEAMNIRIVNTSDENKALLEEIESYNEKIPPKGKNFDDLKSRVLATGDQQLVRNLSVVVYNYANNTFKSGEAKPLDQKEYIMKVALSYYDIAISLDSTYGRPYLNRALSKLRLANINGTINNHLRRQLLEDLKEPLKYEPTMFEVFSNSGMLCMDIAFEEESDVEKVVELKNAAEKFNKAIELYPNDDVVYEKLSTCYWMLAKMNEDDNLHYFKEAVKYIEIAIQKNDNLSHNLTYGSILADYAELDKDNFQNHYDEAITIFKKLEITYGENSEIKYRLGNKFMSLGIHLKSLEYCEKAQKEYEEAIKLNKSDIKILNNLGFCFLHKSFYLMDNDVQSALDSATYVLREVIKIDKDYSIAYLNLGVAYIEKFKIALDKSEVLLEEAVNFLTIGEKLEPGSCTYQIARAFSLKGDVENSIFWLQECVNNKVVFEKQDLVNNEDFVNVIDNEFFTNIQN